MTDPIFPSAPEQITDGEWQSYTELADKIPTSVLRQVVSERDKVEKRPALLRAALNDVQSGSAVLVENYFDALSKIDPVFKNNAEHYTNLFKKSVWEILQAYWATEQKEDQDG
jgi:hypothetical protein